MTLRQLSPWRKKRSNSHLGFGGTGQLRAANGTPAGAQRTHLACTRAMTSTASAEAMGPGAGVLLCRSWNRLQGLLVWQGFKVNLSKNLVRTKSSSSRNTAWLCLAAHANVHSEWQHVRPETHSSGTNTSRPAFICHFWSDLELPSACLFPAFHIWSSLPEAQGLPMPKFQGRPPRLPYLSFWEDLSPHRSLSLGFIL